MVILGEQGGKNQEIILKKVKALIENQIDCIKVVLKNLLSIKNCS